MKHPGDIELALFATRDLSLWQRGLVRLHMTGCHACEGRVESFRKDRERRRKAAGELPEGLDWNSLAAEMTANIHLGLEAGECVTPKDRRIPIFKPHAGWAAQSWLGRMWGGPLLGAPWTSAWKPAAVAAVLTVTFVGAWWLNMPASDTHSLMRAFRSMANGVRGGGAQRIRLIDERAPFVEVSASGISVRENGSALGMSQGGVMRPVAVSVNVQGSASAHYVDDDTGQVTVTSVYVQ